MKAELRALGDPYASAARGGLQAIKAAHRPRIEATSTKHLTGSIDLDATLAKDPTHANAHRWDYGVGFQSSSGQRRCAVWVEVHPANPGTVDDMLRKAAWLRSWLDAHPTIDVLTVNGMRATGTSAMFWVPTGRDSVAKGSTSFRKLATSGIIKRRRVVLP